MVSRGLYLFMNKYILTLIGFSLFVAAILLAVRSACRIVPTEPRKRSGAYTEQEADKTGFYTFTWYRGNIIATHLDPLKGLTEEKIEQRRQESERLLEALKTMK